MDILASTSLIAAFIAGVAALFAPCCITVLLPSYLGSIFKERYKVVLMTFVFFLGVLTVFLPIGLGATAFAKTFSRYHSVIFTGGGLMLVALGVGLLLGKNMALPAFVHPAMRGSSAASVYVLGIFSAVATTCCAPVLAGVIALSVVSGSYLWSVVYTLGYVLGMVSPLFLIALFLDKINFTQKFSALQKSRSFALFGKQWQFSITETAVGILFLSIGGYIIYLAQTGQLAMQNEYQLAMNLWLAGVVRSVRTITQGIPESIWAATLILILIVFTALAFYQYKSKKYEQK